MLTFCIKSATLNCVGALMQGCQDYCIKQAVGARLAA